VAKAVAPIPDSPRRIALQQGRFVDLDGPDTRRQTDVYFAPDRSGSGLYFGVANGARLKLVPKAQANRAGCARLTMRRTPIAARELEREGGVCLRTSDGALSAIQIEGIDRSGKMSVVRFRYETY
jgi:hypothetical protein